MDVSFYMTITTSQKSTVSAVKCTLIKGFK